MDEHVLQTATKAQQECQHNTAKSLAEKREAKGLTQTLSSHQYIFI
jgi:hypothetical protein